MAYSPKNANGQATMANSEPVVIASDQSAIPVSAASLPLPTGASTSAKQDTGNTSLATIAGAVSGTEVQVDVLTMPTTTVTATDLDIRNLVNTDVVTAELSAVDNAVLDAIEADTTAIAASVAAIDTDTTTIIGHLDGVEGLLTTIDADTGSILTAVDGLETSNSAIQTAVQLIDDTVQVLGTDTYTEATSKGITLGAVRRDADTTLVNTTNEFTPLQVDANGRLKVEAFSGETLPVSGTVTETNSGSALTSLQLLDDTVFTDDTSTHATGTTKGLGIMAVAAPTDTALNANDIGMPGMTVNREMYASVTTALPAGTNAIGKLAANSGVDIGDVDVTSVTPGTAAGNLGKAEDAAHASGDTGVFILGVRNDNATTTYGADQDYGPIATDLKGRVSVRQIASTATLSNVSGSASSVTVLAANSARVGGSIYNDSSAIVYLKFGATASTTSFTVKLAADTYYEIPGGYTGIIDGIWASATGSARVTELT